MYFNEHFPADLPVLYLFFISSTQTFYMENFNIMMNKLIKVGWFSKIFIAFDIYKDRRIRALKFLLLSRLGSMHC